jgi:hypothetical protein
MENDWLRRTLLDAAMDGLSGMRVMRGKVQPKKNDIRQKVQWL